jgi:hypothetical protein
LKPTHSAPELPAGEALPINVVARALHCNRAEILSLIENGDLTAFDVRGKNSCRACVRITRVSILDLLSKRQNIGKRTARRARICPTNSRRDHDPASALMALLRPQ